tara:strand:+ start:549 stop:989 length:441 start_codon:yes stop_codon:yes gene_type:complete
MSHNLTLYDKKYELESYEVVFIQNFKDTHSLKKSLEAVTELQAKRINATLRTGKSALALAFKDFVESDPVHPEANKIVILDNLIWIMNQAKEENDTQGVLRAITEINKMIKGNLTTSKESRVIEKHMIGIIDLTKPDKEPKTIDIT